MDSTNILRKTFKLFEKLKEHDSDKVSLLNELFERLLLLKNKYKISFDLESFLKTSLKDIESFNFENDNKDGPENSLKIKKITKKLFNLSLLHLFKLLQNEKYFEFSLDKLVDLMESEFDMAVEVKGVKNVEFLELFLNTLFYGNFYYKGIVQHFLLNSKYTFHLPFTLNNIIKNMEKNRKFNEYLNNIDNNLINRDIFYERFLIFISKLNTPDTYIPRETNEDKVLKIPKKELALKNPIDYLQNDITNNREHTERKEDYDEDSEEDDSEMDDEDVDFDHIGDDKDDNYNVDIMFYGNNYIKLWDNILNDLLYSVNVKNLIIILESLPQLALPYLDNPLRIANFLYNNLKNDVEDIVINSLNCLFELILYHSLTDQIDLVSVNIINDNNSKDTDISNNNNTISDSNNGNTTNNSINDNKDDNSDNEFDWFYQKLYKLVDFKYLTSKSNIVLILLIERALNSSMLPNNLVSTFIKKLLSTSTILETNICNCLLIISLNLLQKHYHHLLFMIHSPSIDNKKDGTNSSSINDNKEDNSDNKTAIEALINKDMIEGSEELKNLTAQEKLFLHELYLLLNHFNYDTVKIIGVFFTDLRLKNKISFNLRDFLHSENLVKHLDKSKDSELNPFKSTVQNSTTLTKSFFE